MKSGGGREIEIATMDLYCVTCQRVSNCIENPPLMVGLQVNNLT